MKLSDKQKEWLTVILWLIIGFFIMLFYVPTTNAQTVIRNGNTFVQIDSSRAIKKDEPTMTKYFYQTIDGTKYPIYKSSKGKYFIIRTSKNGKPYRQYLPEVTKQLSK